MCGAEELQSATVEWNLSVSSTSIILLSRINGIATRQSLPIRSGFGDADHVGTKHNNTNKRYALPMKNIKARA
jgi:hypothetical protein